MRITHVTMPGQCRELHELAKLSQWKAALDIVQIERLVVLMAAGKLKRGEVLLPDYDDRLSVVIERVEVAQKVLCGG
jgi:hypothetical protein